MDPAAILSGLQEAPLDRGKHETIALALALDKALMLMDETVGRKVARIQGLAVCGSLGVLIEAYRNP